MNASHDPQTTLRLTRVLAAPPARVFDSLLDPQVLRAIWSTDDYRIVDMTLDARVGGGWQMTMRDEATGGLNHCAARYVELERPHRIVWLTRWQDGPMAGIPEMRVTLELSPDPSGARLELTHEFFPDRTTRDHHGTGWGAGFDRLAQRLATK